jgi:predicted DNA-binding transcriptional regulator AlpA
MKLMGAQEIRVRLGISRQRTDQIVARPDFPAPIETLAMGRVWRAQDVEKWIAEHRPHLDEDGV